MGIIGTESQFRKKIVRKLKLYPLILIFCQIPCTTYRIYTMFNEISEVPLVLIVSSGVGICINGFFNALIYGFTGAVKKEIRKKVIGNSTSSNSVMTDVLREDLTI